MIAGKVPFVPKQNHYILASAGTHCMPSVDGGDRQVRHFLHIPALESWVPCYSIFENIIATGLRAVSVIGKELSDNNKCRYSHNCCNASKNPNHPGFVNLLFHFLPRKPDGHLPDSPSWRQSGRQLIEPSPARSRLHLAPGQQFFRLNCGPGFPGSPQQLLWTATTRLAIILLERS